MRSLPFLTGAIVALALIAAQATAETPPVDAAPPGAAPPVATPEAEGEGAASAPAEGAESEAAEAESEASGGGESLDQLFAALADETAQNAEFVQRRIGELWSRSGSDSMDLLLARGREALDAEDYDKALAHFSALTRLAPDFAEGWNGRATAQFLLEEYWASVADIQRTLTLEPRHFGALSGLGIILEQTGDEVGALAAHREALRINPHLEGSEEAVKRLEPKVDGRDI